MHGLRVQLADARLRDPEDLAALRRIVARLEALPVDHPDAVFIEDFELFDEWEDRYRYVIELGAALPPFPDHARTDANKVQGCASQVWLVTHERVRNLRRVRALLDFRPLTVPRGEAAKDWETLRDLIQQLSDLEVSRRTPVVAFGGGWSKALMTSRFQTGAAAMFSPSDLPLAVMASWFNTCRISLSTAGRPPA